MPELHRLPILGGHAVPVSRTAPASQSGTEAGAAPVAYLEDGRAQREEAQREELLQVGDLARECGKTVRAIHHYEAVGLLKPHTRSKGRYRLYGRDAIARVRWIHKLHELGMTLTDIQEILALWERAPSAPDGMREIRAVYHQRLAAVREQLERLTLLERELFASLRYLDTCDSCDPGLLTARFGDAHHAGACSSCTHHVEEPEPELVAGLHAGGRT